MLGVIEESRRSCICVLGVIEESRRSCICVLRVIEESRRSCICVLRVIEESRWSCFCVLRIIDLVSVSDFETVLAVCSFLFSISFVAFGKIQGNVFKNLLFSSCHTHKGDLNMLEENISS